MTQTKHDPTANIITQEVRPGFFQVPEDVDYTEEENVFSEAYQWIKAGIEVNPGIVFQAIVGGQLITHECDGAWPKIKGIRIEGSEWREEDGYMVRVLKHHA